MKKTIKFLVICISMVMVFSIIGTKVFAAETVTFNDYSGYSEVEDETINKTTTPTTTEKTTTEKTTSTTSTKETTNKANTATTPLSQTGAFSTTTYIAIASAIIVAIIAVYVRRKKYNF